VGIPSKESCIMCLIYKLCVFMVCKSMGGFSISIFRWFAFFGFLPRNRQTTFLGRQVAHGVLVVFSVLVGVVATFDLLRIFFIHV